MISSAANSTPSNGSSSWVRRNWKWLSGLALVVVVLSRLTLHFGYYEDDVKQANLLIEQFHARMNAGQFDQIYDDADPTFKNGVTRQEWIRHLSESHQGLGSFIRKISSETDVLIGAQVQVHTTYISKFDKGDVAELFSFAREGHKLQLWRHDIFPYAIYLERQQDFQAAHDAVDQFRSHVTAKQYDAIYDNVSEDLKNAAPRDAFIGFVKQVNEKVGSCDAPFLIDNDYARHGDRFVGLVYRRKCQGGEIDERFAFKIEDGKAFLRGYHADGSAFR